MLRCSVRIYWVLLRAGFQRQAVYRLALVSGLVTNAFFGVIRTSVFSALYRHRPEVAGLVRADVLTYIWLLEGMFGVIWATWVWEFAESVRSGDFAVELLRPGDPYLRLAAFDLGRCLNVLLTRLVPVLAVAALVLPLRLPTTPGGIGALAASLVMASVIAFELRLLFGMAAFWTPDYKAGHSLIMPVLYLASGFVIPTDYFPAVLRAVVEASPLFALMMAPVRVAVGQSVAATLAGQVLWLAVLGVGTRALLSLASRRLVVHGG
ncbi:MAG TPA: ABC-2 family transporter protein [Actinomycetota bacterium]|jgi:ABC-2 type transport system permease protein|nr:ABC-2 family transporter protein [Actinomycetota bacterium]